MNGAKVHGSNACDDVNKTLRIDRACLRVWNNNDRPIQLFGSTTECFRCDAHLWANVDPRNDTNVLVDTKHPNHVYYVDGAEFCHTTFSFVEHGRYGWNLSVPNCSSIYTITQPPNPYMPILAAFMVYFFFAATWACGVFIARSGLMARFLRRDVDDVQSDLGRLQENDVPVTPVRVSRFSTRARFLDTFRGIAVLLMIFVNNGGGKYWFFMHSTWNGITVADLVLPFFAWIMGFTLVISMRTQLRISVSRVRIIWRCFQRCVILIILGLIVNSLKPTTLQNLRLAGILQLLGITYFICAMIEAIFMKAQRSFQYGRLIFLQDILDAWVQWLVIIAIATCHTLLTFLLPVPGCPTGYLGPGGLHEHGKYVNCTAGAAGYIDRMILGNHTYHKKDDGVYERHLPYDPEGIMNTMSAVLIVYMGVQAGRIMLTYHKTSDKVIRWLLWSLVTLIIGGALCQFSKEDGAIPLNKSMMTLSYVMVTSSMSFFLNTVLYVMIDLQRWWSGAPFLYAGTNAIFLYVGHELTKGVFPSAWTIAGIPTHGGHLAMNLWTTTLWAIIAYCMYKREVVFTV